MAFITAIDRAVNKDHYASEADKDRNHEAEMNQQFMEMLDKQMGEFEASNYAIWSQVIGSSHQNDELFATYLQGSTDEPQWQTTFTPGPNFNAQGNADYSQIEVLPSYYTSGEGSNFDEIGRAVYRTGEDYTIPTMGVQPNSGGLGSGATDPANLFAQAGIDFSWSRNTGAIYNMNDLIDYFDTGLDEKERPSIIDRQPDRSETSVNSDGAAGSTVAPNEPNLFQPNSASAPSVSDLTSELEDLELQIDAAVEKGTISKDEGETLKSALRDDLKEVGGAANPVEVKHGRVWGDPHFVGADGGNYDVQGEAGKTYNILSDQGLQVNARFDEWDESGSGKTIMGEIGISLGDDQISFDKEGALKINGEEVKEGTYLDGAVTLKNGRLFIEEDEFSFNIKVVESDKGDFLNIEDIRSENANADGVLPSGLWGGTVDGDGIARHGDAGKGTQGGGSINDRDGNITERGDRDAVKSYEVGGLFDTDFNDHNRFGNMADDRREMGDNIDRIGKQLEQLEGVSAKADEVLEELDLRVASGQISESDAEKIHRDIMAAVDKAKQVVVDPSNRNEIFGQEFTDAEALFGALEELDSIDKMLNDLVSEDLKSAEVSENTLLGAVVNAVVPEPLQEVAEAVVEEVIDTTTDLLNPEIGDAIDTVVLGNDGPGRSEDAPGQTRSGRAPDTPGQKNVEEKELLWV